MVFGVRGFAVSVSLQIVYPHDFPVICKIKASVRWIHRFFRV
jgi:hypothetical protein